MRGKRPTVLWTQIPTKCHFDLVKFSKCPNFISNYNTFLQILGLTSDNGSGNVNYPQTQPGTFPPTDNTRPATSNFIPPSSTIGTYPTDGSDGTTGTVDFSTTPYGSSFPPDPSSSPEDLYTIKNKYPTTLPATSNVPTSNNPTANTPSTPGQPPNYGSKPTEPQYPTQPHFRPKPDKPSHCIKCINYPPTSGHSDVDRDRDRDRIPSGDRDRYPYPVQGPDPFPDYHPQYHPMFSYPLMYGHGYPSDREYESYPSYPQPIPAPHPDDFGLPPGHPSLFAGRYPEPDMNAILPPTGYGSGGYGGGNRYPEGPGQQPGGNYYGGNTYYQGSHLPSGSNHHSGGSHHSSSGSGDNYPSNKPGNQPVGPVNPPAAPGYNVVEETPDTSMAKRK